LEVLNYLRPKYRLHIITNGFREVQEGKLRISGLNRYFECIITSEEAGYMKPDIRIFEYALRCARAIPEKSLMIGDDFLVDIEGAKAAGMEQALILWRPLNNNHFDCNYTLSSLSGLRNIL
jgi:putative hydrolase of the HAD superfamily